MKQLLLAKDKIISVNKFVWWSHNENEEKKKLNYNPSLKPQNTNF